MSAHKNTTPPVAAQDAHNGEDSPQEEGYSPSRPYCLGGGFWDQVEGITVQGEEPCSSAAANLVVVDSNVPAVIPAIPDASYDLSSIDWDCFLQSPVIKDWYGDELAHGDLDHLDLSYPWSVPGPSHAAPPAAPSSFEPIPAINPDIQALLDLLQAGLNKGAAPFLLPPAFVPTVNPFEIGRKCSLYANDDGPDDHPNAVSVSPNLNIVLDNANLHQLNPQDASSDEASVADEVDSSDDEEEVLETEEVIRYNWNQGDVRFLIQRGQERLLLTFESLEERFSGMKSTIWAFWQRRKRGRVDAAKVREYMRCHGHSSFHSRCMWHLLPESEERMLIAAQRKGILHKVRL